jgi:hypothetical protein
LALNPQPVKEEIKPIKGIFVFFNISKRLRFFLLLLFKIIFLLKLQFLLLLLKW